jgi:hypothetical protein
MSESDSNSYILDSFALLAYLDGKPGAPRVKALLGSAERDECRVGMSIINLGDYQRIPSRRLSPAQLLFSR